MRDARMARGIAVALMSGVAFAMSGPFGKPLMEAGWTPGAVVLTRLWIAAAVTVVPMVLFARARLVTLRRAPGSVIAYGLIAVLATNLSYFYAVARMSVTVALLIEFSAPVVVIAYLWARFGRRPSALTGGGAAIAVAGLALVVGAGHAGAVVTPAGVAWASVALIGVVGYFLMAHDGSESADGPEVDQLALAVGGLVVAALALTALWLVGAVPVRVVTVPVHLGVLGTAPWWVPALVVGAVATGLAYLAGIVAINLLGPTLASFVAFSEVLVSTLAAWALLGETLAPVQLGGAVLIVIGVVGVKRGERSDSGSDPALAGDSADPGSADGRAFDPAGRAPCAAAGPTAGRGRVRRRVPRGPGRRRDAGRRSAPESPARAAATATE
ncbi:EamA family transporter [Tsukamurella soli]|uniref:EamA family transporter n=1 Tax=Tsukamurella soli TaxID=644556 RepID=A0ABP8KA19_9ACTN